MVLMRGGEIIEPGKFGECEIEMIFKKYSSIENITRKKLIDYIIERGFANKNIEWVSTLKVHGANYAIYANKREVKHAKRSGWIGENSFYGDYNFDYDNNVKALLKHIGCEQISVHGEIFGGIYLHPDVERDKSAVRVQKEVQYCPHNDFIVFDIKINGKLIPWDDVKQYCNDFGFLHVPELYRGTFEELLDKPVVFHDPVYKLFNLPSIADKDAEGWVMKPAIPLFFGNGERVILKGKNPKLSEKSKKIKKPKKPKIDLSEEGNKLLNEVLSYLNENRLRNVLSHGDIENITHKDFGKLLGFFAKDAFDDFMKDYGEEFDKLEKKEKVSIKKTMNKEAGNIIRPNFVNIIDGEF